MSEPLRTEPARPTPSSEADRAARIEQLLLSGLDHYFAGKYERAINIWTRVAFLERGHGRARAYIERARGALAERLRESEECLHQGIAAYHAGEWQRSRDLLTRAVEQGGNNELALVFLQRLGRLDAVKGTARHKRATTDSKTSGRAVEHTAHRTNWLWTGAASIVVVGLIFLAALRTASWLRESPVDVRTSDAVSGDPLPIVREAERRIDRARMLRSAGRLREALEELSAIQIGDAARLEADRMRSDIQRVLLSATPGSEGNMAR